MTVLSDQNSFNWDGDGEWQRRTWKSKGENVVEMQQRGKLENVSLYTLIIYILHRSASGSQTLAYKSLLKQTPPLRV